MSYEIWALDAGAGQAVLRGDEGWYLLSIHSAWRPVLLSADRALHWSLRSQSEPVGNRYATLDEAVMRARSLCLEILRPDLTTVDENILESSYAFRRIIVRFCGPLDRYFESRGFTEEESFTHSLTVLNRFFQWAGANRYSEEETGVALFELAQSIRGKQASDKREPGPSEPDSRNDQQLVSQLSRLSDQELICLSLWGPSQYRLWELADLLRWSRAEIEAALDHAASKLGRSIGQLRGPRLGEIFRWELHRRLLKTARE